MQLRSTGSYAVTRRPNRQAEIDQREARLTQQFGELLSVADLASVLRYPSAAAVRQARRRGRLPVEMQLLSGRRGWFATARAVAEYLYQIDVQGHANAAGKDGPCDLGETAVAGLGTED